MSSLCMVKVWFDAILLADCADCWGWLLAKLILRQMLNTKPIWKQFASPFLWSGKKPTMHLFTWTQPCQEPFAHSVISPMAGLEATLLWHRGKAQESQECPVNCYMKLQTCEWISCFQSKCPLHIQTLPQPSAEENRLLQSLRLPNPLCSMPETSKEEKSPDICHDHPGYWGIPVSNQHLWVPRICHWLMYSSSTPLHCWNSHCPVSSGLYSRPEIIQKHLIVRK